MRILCVIDSLGSGGAQRQLVGLAIGFKEKGHEVSFLVYYNNNFFYNTLARENIQVTSVIEPNYLKRLLKMRRHIRRGNFDAVLSFLEASNFICEVAGLPSRKWKLVVGERSANPNILKSCKLRIYRWFHLLADYVVANSHNNLALVKNINPLLSEKKCRIISNMVDLNKWKPSGIYIPKKNGKCRLIVLASHSYTKNLNGLVEAVSLLNKDEKGKLIIEWYGDKIDEPYIDNSLVEARMKIMNYGIEPVFKFFPATIDVAEVITHADGVGLFSYYEGFPNTVCEGMACKKPVICSKVSDIPRFLSYDQNLLFDATEPVSIASSIKYFLKLNPDELEAIGEKNRELAVIHFDKEIIIEEYLNLLS